MRVALVLCTALHLGCTSPDPAGAERPAIQAPADDAEQFARWQDAYEKQIEADARAGATMTFESEEDARRFLHSLTPAGFRARPEFFASLAADVGDIEAHAAKMAAYAQSHPDELERRLGAFMPRLMPLLEQVGANIQRQFPPARWQSDPAVALADARQRGRATVVLFTAAWSMAAKELERTFADPSVRKLVDERYVAALVDATDDQAPGVQKHLEAHAVTATPTVLVFDAQGREVARHTATMNRDDLLALLERTK